MNADTVVIQGIVLADGTLQLEDKILLSPGKVNVTLWSAPYPERAAEFMEFLRGIRAIRERDGVRPDAAAAIAAARKVRDEFDEQVEETGRLQDECRHLRLEAEAKKEAE